MGQTSCKFPIGNWQPSSRLLGYRRVATPLAIPQSSVADPNSFDTDSDPDPAYQFDTDLDPTVGYGSGFLPFQRGNVPKTVLFIHLNLIFLVSRSNSPIRRHT
jgi:hypothetical protein